MAPSRTACFAVAAAAAAAALLLPRAAAYDNGVTWAAKPPMGWASWCTDDVCGLLDFCNEAEFLGVADALVSTGMRDLGYKLLLADDCWAADTRDAAGNLQPDPTRFPSGIDYLVQQVHARGLYLGLYTCAGERTCKFNRTGSGGHYEQDANWFAAHDVDYVKMDNCGHPATAPPVYYGQFSAFLNATGKPIWFATCEWGEDDPATWAPSMAQSFRSGPDHLPFWSFNLTNGGQGVLDIINTMALIGNATGPYGWNDPDFLETDELFFTHAESETEFAAWAMFGGPLILATDVRNMSAWKRSVVLNAEILSLNQDALLAPGARVALDGARGTQVWAKRLAGGDVAVLLINAGAAAQAVAVAWPALGWPAAANASVRDLWAHAELGHAVGGWTADAVAPHGNALLRLTRVAG